MSTMAQAVEFSDAPMLKEKIEAGILPVVDERLPETPMIVQPTNMLGKYGGTWRMGMRRGRDHALLIRTMGYENLMRWNPEWTSVIPNIAKSYTVNDDATEYVFYLRPGMRWSDGDFFDADDIMFWYEHVATDPVLSQDDDIWFFSGGEKAKVEKRGDHAVAFIFDHPHALFTQFLAGPEGVEPTSYPSHYLKQFHPAFNPNVDEEAKAAGFEGWHAQFLAKFGEPGNVDNKTRWMNKELPTLNAWVLDSTHTIDEPLSAVRNPYYWKVDPAGLQLPYIDRLHFEVVKSKSDIRDVARAGNIDMQARAMPSFAEQVNASPSDWPGVNTFGVIDTDMNKAVIALNLNHRDPVLKEIFNTKDFRVALSVSIDRAAIIRSAGENIGVPFQAAPRPESDFYNEKLAKQYLEYVPGQAAKMLDDLGLMRGEDGIRRRPDGKRLSFFIDTVGDDRYDVLLKVAKDWRAIGVDVTARNLAQHTFYDTRELNEHDASSWGGDGGIAVIQSPIFYFPIYYESVQAVNWARWYRDPSDPKAEEPTAPVKKQMELYRKIVKTQSQEEQSRLMREILDIAAEEFYVFGVSLPPIRYGIYRQGFENVPALMPAAWTYPTPAPTNPAQYFFR
ncbi:ABC transporter substrate-binding protein [Curvivirga sp.]|uniref:ABC transporter substrate-binding protein n=1 Tax=Curvivirga sp. TaxID=2856848 RepID=UPI003B5C2889